MPDYTVVDEAYARSRLMYRCIDEGRRTSTSSGSMTVLFNTGLVKQGKKGRALERGIEDAYSSLSNLTNYVTILDMAASFEMYAIARLRTIKGEARKSVQDSLGGDIGWIENVINVDVQGLSDIANILGIQGIDKDLIDSVRNVRNSFAHGTNIENSTKITAEQTRDILNRMIEILG